MALTNEKFTPFSQAPVVCRVCLATTGKMFCFVTSDLQQAFFNITGMEVSPGDGLPQHICYICRGLMQKATEFRNKCHSTHKLLSSHPVTLELIQNIHRLQSQQLQNTNIVFVNIDSNFVNPQSDVESDNGNNFNNDNDNEESKCNLSEDIENDYANNFNYFNEQSQTALTNPQEDTDLKWATENNLNDNHQSDNDLTTMVDEKGGIVDTGNDETKNCILLGEIKSEETQVISIDTKYTPDNPTAVKYKKMFHHYIQEKYVSKTFKPITMKSDNSKKIVLYKFLNEKYGYEGKYQSKYRKGSKSREDHYLKVTKNHAEKNNFKVEFFSMEEQIGHLRARMNTDEYKKAKFKCTDCYTGFRLEHKYKEHRERHDSAINGNYKCEVCNLRYPTKKRLCIHTGLHRRRFTCQECGKFILQSNKLQEHFNSHNGGSKYECKYCSKDFRKRRALAEHTQLRHASAPCPVCHLMMMPRGVELHMKLQHVKTFTCSSCNKVFNDYAAIATHIHTSPNGVCGADAWPCTKCGENFNTESDLRGHIGECRRRTIKEAKRKKRTVMRKNKEIIGNNGVVCEWCAKIYPNHATYRMHARGHTGERPFACPECPKAFRVKQQLKSHIAYTHARERERQYKCSECSKSFYSLFNMQKHFRFVHEKLRPHACPICSKSFQEAHYIKLHMNTVHMNMPWPTRNRKRKRNGNEEGGEGCEESGEGCEESGEGCEESGEGCEESGEGFEESGEGFEESGEGCENIGEGCEESGEGCEESGEGCEESGEGCEESGEGCEESGEGCEESGEGCEEMEDVHFIVEHYEELE